MKRLQKKQPEFRGAITPFLSLIFILILSLAGAMIQSASIQTSKGVKRAEMTLALENIFAEYHVELLQSYDIFGREGAGEAEIEERLKFYGVVDTQHEIMQSTLLSDQNGNAFYEQAIKSMGGEVRQEEISADFFAEQEEEAAENRLDSLLEAENTELPTENNPMEFIKILKNSSLLSLVYPNPEQLSKRNIVLENVASHRTLQSGIGNAAETSEKSTIDHGLFALYLEEHFSSMMKTEEYHPLMYELEYLIGGKESDQENLTAAAKKILAIRMAVNYAYLLTDETKQLEAQGVALGLSSLLTAPDAAELVKQVVLIAWAYGESIADIRVLFRGEGVALVKTADTWQLSFENIFQLMSQENLGEKNVTDGITYTDYIKALLMAEKRETLCMRALDLIELNTGIRADECMTAVSIESVCYLRRQVTYTFQTQYKYD